MIVFKRYGHTFRIRNDDWKGLRTRFNPDNARLIGSLWSIEKKCLLCKKYRRVDGSVINCGECPFAVIERFGCLTFLDKIIKRKYFNAHAQEDVWWKKKYNKKARQQLWRLQKKMDKIEEENK